MRCSTVLHSVGLATMSDPEMLTRLPCAIGETLQGPVLSSRTRPKRAPALQLLDFSRPTFGPGAGDRQRPKGEPLQGLLHRCDDAKPVFPSKVRLYGDLQRSFTAKVRADSEQGLFKISAPSLNTKHREQIRGALWAKGENPRGPKEGCCPSTLAIERTRNPLA